MSEPAPSRCRDAFVSADLGRSVRLSRRRALEPARMWRERCTNAALPLPVLMGRGVRGGFGPTAPDELAASRSEMPGVGEIVGAENDVPAPHPDRYAIRPLPALWGEVRKTRFRSIRLDVIAAVFAHRALERRPVDAGAAADVGKRFVDAGLHALQPADIDMRARVFHQGTDG